MKNKKYLKLFSLIFAIFISFNLLLVGVYCYDDLQETIDGEINRYKFNYNIFNANLIPFYVDLSSGIGWYYTGFIPEISIYHNQSNDFVEKYSAFSTTENVNSNDYNDMFLKLLNRGHLYDFDLRIHANSFKTHFYYYDGTELKLYSNGSNNHTFNNRIDFQLGQFLENIGGEAGTGIIYKNIVNDDYTLTNFCLTTCNGDRSYFYTWGGTRLSFGVYKNWLTSLSATSDRYNDGQEYSINGFGFYPSYFYNKDGKIENDTQYYTNNINVGADGVDLSEISNMVNNHPIFSDGDMALTNMKINYIDVDKDGIYTSNDNIQINYFGSTHNNDYSIEKDNVTLYFYFDILNSTTRDGTRIYLTAPQLRNNYGATWENGILTFNIGKILATSSLYKVGVSDDVSIVGIGGFYRADDPENINANAPYLTFSSGNYISNHQYIVLTYHNNAYVCATYSRYTLSTDYSTWKKDLEEPATNEKGTVITDGIDPDYYLPEDDQKNFDSIIVGVDDFFNTVDSVLDTLEKYSVKLGSFFGEVFKILPNELIELFNISLLFTVCLGLYNLFKN